MSDNIFVGCSYRTNKADMIKELAKYRQTLNTSPIMVITSPTEKNVRYYVEKCNIKDFDMNSATYELYSNVKIEYNTETGECKILIFNGRTGEIIASYEGVNEDLRNVEIINKDEKYETPDDIYFDEHNEARAEQEVEEDLGYVEGDNEDEK